MLTEENFIDCTCPHCGATASFPQSHAGLLQACPACMEDIIVPDADGSPARRLPLPITTSRLILRRPLAGDWKGLMECFQDEDEERATQWLEQEAKNKLTTPERPFGLAIEQREGGRFIGYVGLRLTAARQGALNFYLHPEYLQSDLAVEALDGLLGFCFEDIRLHRVTAALDSEDAAGLKLCEDVGLRREGTFLKDVEKPEGGWSTSVWFAALEEDYLDDSPDPK